MRDVQTVDPDDTLAVQRAAIEAWPWKTTAEKARPIAPCGEPCGPEGCMARGCPVAR